MNFFIKRQTQEKHSHLEIYKDLAKLKQEPAFALGDIEYLLITNQVFSFIRKLPGKASYVVVMNLSDRNLTLNLNFSRVVPATAKVSYVFGANPDETKELRKFYPINEIISTKRVLLNAKNCIILTY